ncbi:MAG TPA: 2'-deoxycytidine 5'-triphosphate deaminase [Deltaproteobacteria bacterium]|nr:2'-deoxycytidine 5'-triphosphate deaminase [Deltaproteobacteria bacterium]
MTGEAAHTGVLGSQEIEAAIEKGWIGADAPIEERQVQPASLDLRLGRRAYRLVSSFLPEGRDIEGLVLQKDYYGDNLVMYEVDIGGDGGVLERGGVYLIPLKERLALPGHIRGRSNPKSTTGRLDIFARLITDRNPRFDDIAAGYRGGLYLEVMPRSYTVKVREGLRLAQIRLMTGPCRLDDDEIREINERYSLLFDGDSPLPTGQMTINDGVFMSVDLSGDASGGIVGYKSKKNSHIVDLSKTDHYKIEDFWEPVHRTSRESIILEPEDFYILSSKERIRVPPRYAAEMAAYEAGSGELRTHYAGFFDPGFGFGSHGEIRGTKAVLEVRAHDVPFMVVHGQTFFKLSFERMGTVPRKVYGVKIGSSYQFQGITLSKQFRKDGGP